MNLSKKYQIILLLSILVLASFFRLWQIDSIPPGLYPDEAINGLDALKTLETGQFKVFYPENNGREGLFIWLIALSFKLFGPAAWSIRLVSAIFGILTVLGLYLLAKELFFGSLTPKNLGVKLPKNIKNSKVVALLSSFFLAVSFWHINFSRIGFRAILVPFLICFSFYFLFRAFRRKSSLDYLWSGIFFSLGFYTYIAFRMALLILGIVILMKIIEYWRENKPIKINWLWLWKKAYRKDGWWRIDLFLIIIIIVALPLGFYFLNHPQDFIGRAGDVSIFSSQEPFKELGLSAIKTLGMFNFSGDGNWRHNYAGSPMLAWSVGLFFILGLVLIVLSLRGVKPALLAKRGERRSNPERLSTGLPRSPNGSLAMTSSVFLLSWFVIMLLPAILTSEGLPHALRTIGVIPVVCIMAGLGLFWLINKLSQATKILKTNQLIVIALLIASLCQPALANFEKYFFNWAKNPNVAGAFREDLVDLANYLNSLPDNIQKYVIVNEPGVAVPYPDGLPMPAQTIIFESISKTPSSQIKYLLPETGSQVKISKQPLIIIPLKYDQAIFQQLSEKWPQGKIEDINGFKAYQIQ